MYQPPRCGSNKFAPLVAKRIHGVARMRPVQGAIRSAQTLLGHTVLQRGPDVNSIENFIVDSWQVVQHHPRNPNTRVNLIPADELLSRHEKLVSFVLPRF